MKVRKEYVLYVNQMLGIGVFGNNKFNRRVVNYTIGTLFYCSLSDLKYNIRQLTCRGYQIIKQNY